MTDQNTDDAVEAVARAIYEADCALHLVPPNYGRSTEENPRSFKTAVAVYKATARAAITAYREHLEAAGVVIVPREPTEAMIKATDGLDIYWGYRGEEGGFPQDVYRAMITAYKDE